MAGDKAVHVFDADGTETIGNRPGRPADVPGRRRRAGFYVGVGTHVEVHGPDGKRIARWDDLGDRAVLTSIAADEDDVFVADAGDKIVLRYDTSGKLLGRIGGRDAEKGIPGFVIPSPYFDLAVAPDGLLRVVNPGNHRIETFTPEGHYETPLAWGKPGLAIEGFCGCCNPVNIAILADGRIVTAEKGIPRVKVYSGDGRFECVVAGPEQLAPTDSITEETRDEYKLLAVDLAVDSRQRVLVLDPAAHSVRIFEHEGQTNGSDCDERNASKRLAESAPMASRRPAAAAGAGRPGRAVRRAVVADAAIRPSDAPRAACGECPLRCADAIGSRASP